MQTLEKLKFRLGRRGITQERGILVGEEHYLILSYFILSYLILSYLILSYLILSYLIQHYLILSPAVRKNPNHIPTLST